MTSPLTPIPGPVRSLPPSVEGGGGARRPPPPTKPVRQRNLFEFTRVSFPFYCPPPAVRVTAYYPFRGKPLQYLILCWGYAFFQPGDNELPFYFRLHAPLPLRQIDFERLKLLGWAHKVALWGLCNPRVTNKSMAQNHFNTLHYHRSRVCWLLKKLKKNNKQGRMNLRWVEFMKRRLIKLSTANRFN